MGSSQEPTFSSASTAAQVNACALDLLPVYAKELIAGGAAGAFAKTAVKPLERVKILLQTITEGFQSFGILQSLRKLWQYEGIRAFYKGNDAGVLRMVPYAALHYMTYEQYRCWILNNFAPSVGTGPVVDLLAGSAAGGAAVLCTYPLDLARTKLTYQVSNVAQPGNALGNSGRHLRLHGGVVAQEPGAGRGAPRRPHSPRGVRQYPTRVLGRPRWPSLGLAPTGEMRKTEASRRRCEAANLEMLLGDKERELRCCHKLAELTEDDLEDFITSLAALAAENSELKIKLKEVESHAELSENTADHGHSARDLRADIRKLKQAYKTMNSKKDKEVSALLAEKDFVWNQLRTMEQDYTVLLKKKKIEAAQATEAAQKLQQNVEELQVAAQKKDGEIGRLRAEAVDAKKKISILGDKLQEMCSLAKEKDDEIEKLKDGQPETSQKRKKYINKTSRKSRSEGTALREKSKNNSRRQMVDEDEQPETSQKRNCTSSLSNGLRRCSARLQGKTPVSPAVQPVLFSPNFKVPMLKSPTPTWPEAASPPPL